MLPQRAPTGSAPLPRLNLEPGEAHVWYCWTRDCDSETLRASYRSLLSAEEAARLERFAFDYLKLEYLVTRALCRYTLSRYAGTAPAHWTFRANDYGRPEIADAAMAPGLRFNLSNSRSLVACVVTRDLDAGVDVEALDRRGDVVSIADHYFSPDELQVLRARPSAEQTDHFFQLWTLKESYIKARGMGLSIPLKDFSFSPLERPIRIAFAPALPDTAEDWQFELFRPDPNHLLALGLRRGRAADCRVTLFESLPHAAEPARTFACAC
ncbi:4'-phosphopantetheinyl transferase family protein [Tahibacter harae]|uniref:4'-phosphopantetheinyl transferase superfamily protein n=1 Tax=Tahibacter harae TaxID=2963937 RepID=A0ABT1QT60_9GAMM|nr:4'-phosphopantetheinyl transferase superfamily protein [Tahibacter harae]MCQ4165456.1 4'-phosphopantetheinyl transferase superfamily protein [Tahibacter harae]